MSARSSAAILFLSLAGASLASAQTPGTADDPEILRRCQAAPTLILRTICDNPDLRALERDIRRYVNLQRTRDPSVDTGQDAFERQRERACGGMETADGYDGPAYRCVRLHQRIRLVQLATSAMGKGISGFYRSNRPDMQGELMIAEWPDGSAQILIDTLTPPDARTCSIQFQAAASPAMNGMPVGAPSCRISIDALGGTATVRSDGDCRTVCVLNGRPDGLYRR
ncbi:MAG: hypothetical protein KIT16_05930 [Rhodospirillaceae bacterium]|nr:hypothetical protein [Rhodospirillaceae bacterium]